MAGAALELSGLAKMLYPTYQLYFVALNTRPSGVMNVPVFRQR